MSLIFEPFANTELVLGGAEKLWYFFGMLLALSNADQLRSPPRMDRLRASDLRIITHIV